MPKTKITEKQLCNLWKNLGPGTILPLRGGQLAVLEHPGIANQSDGPDFYMARIRIEGILHVGSVEIHVDEISWFRHGHHNDKKYDGIILHVLLVENPKSAVNKPTFVIPFSWLYDFDNREPILSDMNSFRSNQECLDSLEQEGIKRLKEKSRRVAAMASICRFDLQQVFFISLLRSYGLPYNEEAMEILGLQIPYRRIMQCADSTMIETILTGSAGFLDGAKKDKFPIRYHDEWALYTRKFQVEPLRSEFWNHSAVRPYSAPYHRLVHAAAFFNWYFSFMPGFRDWCSHSIPDPGIFSVVPGVEWVKHRDILSGFKPVLYPGPESRKVIYINGLIPFLLFYATYSKQTQAEQKLFEKLRVLSAEDNRLIRNFCQTWHISYKCLNMLQGQGIISIIKHTSA